MLRRRYNCLSSSSSVCKGLLMSADETSRDTTAAETTVDSVSSAPRLLVVDDQAEMRWSVAPLLADTFQVVGVAEDGKEAIELAECGLVRFEPYGYIQRSPLLAVIRCDRCATRA